MILVRSFAMGAPLPGLDVRTGSQRAALDEAAARAREYGSWDDVQVTIPGDRPYRGRELRELCQRAGVEV